MQDLYENRVWREWILTLPIRARGACLQEPNARPHRGYRVGVDTAERPYGKAALPSDVRAWVQPIISFVQG